MSIENELFSHKTSNMFLQIEAYQCASLSLLEADKAKQVISSRAI